MFFSLCPDKAVINDINRELVNLYRTVKERPEELIAAIDRVDDGIPDDADAAKAYYYAMRERYNEIIASEVLDTEAAA